MTAMPLQWGEAMRTMQCSNNGQTAAAATLQNHQWQRRFLEAASSTTTPIVIPLHWWHHVRKEHGATNEAKVQCMQDNTSI
jgi:hypothetical protein